MVCAACLTLGLLWVVGRPEEALPEVSPTAGRERRAAQGVEGPAPLLWDPAAVEAQIAAVEAAVALVVAGDASDEEEEQAIRALSEARATYFGGELDGGEERYLELERSLQVAMSGQVVATDSGD